jgi:uncharacterized protein (UPF0335 family)
MKLDPLRFALQGLVYPSDNEAALICNAIPGQSGGIIFHTGMPDTQKQYRYRYKKIEKLEEIKDELVEKIKDIANDPVKINNYFLSKSNKNNVSVVKYENSYEKSYIDLIIELKSNKEDAQIAHFITLLL